MVFFNWDTLYIKMFSHFGDIVKKYCTFQSSFPKMLKYGDDKKSKLIKYVQKDRYEDDRQALLEKLASLTSEQVEMQEELREMRQYCKYYAKHYSDLKLEFMQTKHFVLKELNKDLPTSQEFFNSPNGLKLRDDRDSDLSQGSSSRGRSDDGIDRKVSDMMGRIDELEQEVNLLRLENRSLKSMTHSRDDSQSSGSSKKSSFGRNGETVLYIGEKGSKIV